MNKMLSEALREFTTGPLNQLIVNLGGQDGDQWEQQLKRFLRKEPCWINGQVPQVAESESRPSILEFVSTVKVNATTNEFVARDKFKLKKDSGICSYLEDNFKAWFLKGDGKVEEPFTGSTLRCDKLLKVMTDMPQEPGQQAIIPELGGEAKAETTLTEMSSQMEKQENGETGVLLTNGYANIFYIRDQKLVRRTVYVSWYGAGWSVRASSVEFPFRWLGGNQVFSRNSQSLETQVTQKS